MLIRKLKFAGEGEERLSSQIIIYILWFCNASTSNVSVILIHWIADSWRFPLHRVEVVHYDLKARFVRMR